MEGEILVERCWEVVMNKNRYPSYGVIIVAGAAIAVGAGMPLVYLLFLLCPLMMFFMMAGMTGTQGRHDDSNAVAPPAPSTAVSRQDERL